MRRTEKEIEFYTEVLKLLTFVLVASAGGTVGFLFKLNNPITVPLVVLGVWVSFSLFLGIAWTTLKIRTLLRRLDD